MVDREESRARDSIGSTGSDFLSRLEAKLSFMEDTMDDTSPEKNSNDDRGAVSLVGTPPRARVSRTPFSTPAAPSSSTSAADRSGAPQLFSSSMQPTRLSPYRDRTAELEVLAKRSAERKKHRQAREEREAAQDAQRQRAQQLQQQQRATAAVTPNPRTTTPQPKYSGQALRAHLERQEQARQQNTLQSIQDGRPNELPLTNSQVKAKSTHIERQELARKLRHDAERSRIGTDPPMEGATGPYWSKDGVAPDPTASTTKLTESRSGRGQGEASEREVVDNVSAAGNRNSPALNAIVTNHTKNDSHKVSPAQDVDYNNTSGEISIGRHRGSPSDEKLSASDLADSASGPRSALETDIFSVDRRGRESKGGEAQFSTTASTSPSGEPDPAARTSERLDVSDKFDITSPYHPQFKANISFLGKRTMLGRDSSTNPPPSDLSSRGERVLTGLHGKGLSTASSSFSAASTSSSSPASNPVEDAAVAVATATSSNWARIFNGSGTKQRVARKIQKGREAAKRVAPRVIRQREVIKSLSSHHIDAVVCSGTTETVARAVSNSPHRKKLMTPAAPRSSPSSLTPGRKVAMYPVSHHFSGKKLKGLSSSPLYRLQSPRSATRIHNNNKIMSSSSSSSSRDVGGASQHSVRGGPVRIKGGQRNEHVFPGGHGGQAIRAGEVAAKSASELLSEALSVLTRPSRR